MNFSFRILLTCRVAIIVISLFSFWRDIDEERRIYAEIIFFNHNLKCSFLKDFLGMMHLYLTFYNKRLFHES